MRRLLLTTLLSAVLLSAPSLAAAATHESPAQEHAAQSEQREKSVITIGLVDTFSPDFYIRTYSPTLDHLLASLPEHRFRFVELDYRSVEADIERLHPDFLVTSGSLYAALMGSVGMHQIATRQPKTSPKPSETVSSAFVVRSSSPYRTLADLKGARVAISDRRSFDGWLIAQGELAREGLDPERHFSEVIETEYGVPDVGTLIKIGAADVGVLATCEYEQLSANGLIKPGEFRILAEKPSMGGCVRSTERYPDVVFSSLPWVDAETVREATVSLLSMPADALDFRWTVCNDFVPTFELLRTLSLGPFAGQNDLTFEAIWRRWKTEILLGLLLLAAVLFHIVTINLLVRKRTAQLSEALAETERFFREAREARNALLTIERTNIVAQLSSMFAHEIKQPIMNISLYAGALRMLLARLGLPERTTTKAASILDALDQEVERSADIVEHVRSYAKKRTRNPVPCDLCEVARDAVKTVEVPGIRIENKLEPGLCVLADPFELLFVLSNFLRNAAAAVRDVPEPLIKIEGEKRGAVIRVGVTDNGPVISDADFERLGKVGASAKADGLGFGLAIASAIAEANGGHLEFERALPHGLRAVLVLAAARKEAENPVESRRKPAAETQSAGGAA